MSKITEKEIEGIRKRMDEEFPNDPALQQVHIARKIIAREAELEGLSFLEYIKLLRKRGEKGTDLLCGRARSCNQMGANPIPEGWPATG